jgi:5-carboxymethyl-2-hydroxymuconate isomerase
MKKRKTLNGQVMRTCNKRPITGGRKGARLWVTIWRIGTRWKKEWLMKMKSRIGTGKTAAEKKKIRSTTSRASIEGVL